MLTTSTASVASLRDGELHSKADEPTAVGPARSAGIDVLRGICVLLVLLHHIHLRFKGNQLDVKGLLPAAVGRVVFWSGYYSVITFFVISGFLITTLSVRRWGSLNKISLPEFYWLRFSRIVPCLLMLVLLLSILHIAQADGFVIPPERASLGRAVFAALTFHVNWLEGQRGYLPGSWDVLWSLSVEEVFYLAFPVLCLSLRRLRWLLLPMFALIVIGPFNRVAGAGRVPWDEYAYLSCMDAIAFGCLAALVTSRLRHKLTPRVLHSMMVLGIAAVTSILIFQKSPLVLTLHEVGLGLSVLEAGVALILIPMSLGIGSALLTRGTGPIRMVGRCSYEIYLTHMLMVLGLTPLIASTKPVAPWILGWYVALSIASVALGWFVHWAYSEPLNAALRSRLRSQPIPQELRSAG